METPASTWPFDQGTLIVHHLGRTVPVRPLRYATREFAASDRIAAEAKALREIGIGTIAIMPNDTNAYPQDSFDNMKAFAARHGFTFPYVIDSTQEVARAYDAQCTPDFFGFNTQDELHYRGRLDASRTTPVPNIRRDLFEAMKLVVDLKTKFLPWAVRSSGSTEDAWATVVGRGPKEAVDRSFIKGTSAQLLGE